LHFTEEPAVMCPSHFLTSQNQVRVTSPSSQSHLKFLDSSQRRVMTWSSRVARTVESLRVIALQARINVESHEISRFFCYLLYLFAMKWRPTCHKIAPDKLENGPQHAMK